jgi:preprotein translocase subunit SecF
VEQRRVEFVGPQVGDELATDGGLAILVALLGIFIYVMIRFEWRFALGAIVATLHDVVITVGLFSVTGLEFDLTVLAAVLAVIGYSVNDTVVVFDRIRENFRKMRKAEPAIAMNAAINQTLSRTTITSLVTLLAVLALLFFGGGLIRNFSIALVAGIVIGTFSSIYVASAIALWLGVSKADLMPVKKEGADLDARP